MPLRTRQALLGATGDTAMVERSILGWNPVARVIGRFVIGVALATALAIWPSLAEGTGAAVGGTRGQLLVSVVGGGQGTGPVCVTLRDLTEQMVVGSYCDGDDADGDSRRGRIALDLPRRSFAVDARVRGGTIESISPRHFDLGRRQTVLVRLGSKR
jgi:hypothetical protein